MARATSRSLLEACILGATVTATCLPASAQVEEITVTAQKRIEKLQDVPMSISALDARTLEKLQITEFVDYAVRIPNLSFGYVRSGQHGSQSIAVRGIFGQDTTGFYIDETPTFGSLDPRVVDLDRIEVLRGPQGTLYGARSMGGTVKLVTRQPNTEAYSATGHASLSSTEEGGLNYGVDGTVNIPLVDDRLAARAVVYYQSKTGLYDRVPAPGAPVQYAEHDNVDGERTFGAQLAFKLRFADAGLTITPRFMYQRDHTNGFAYADGREGNFRQSRLFDLNEPGVDDWKNYSLTIAYDALGGQFVSSTSHFDRFYNDQEDFSEVAQYLFGNAPQPAIIRVSANERRTVQELRYASSFRGPVQLTAGFFYQDTEQRRDFPPTPVPTVSSNIFSQNLRNQVTEVALFGELTWRVTERLRLIGGARWFDNKVDFVGSQDGLAVSPDSFAGTQSERDVNPKFGIQFDLDSSKMLYATAAKGFRIGGVNAISSQLCAADLARLRLDPAQAKTFQSDSLWSYEAGAKTEWFDRKLRVNLAGYYIDWSNVQQLASLSCGFIMTVNAGAAVSRGFELEVEAAPTDQLRLNFSAGFTDAHITDNGGLTAVREGARIQQVPRWSVAAGAEYRFLVGKYDAFARADYTYTGSSLSQNNIVTTPRHRSSLSLVNLRAAATFGRVEVGLFAENLLNRFTAYSDIPPLTLELPGRPRILGNRPRTIGLDARITLD